jgi:DivIVA domain-containing protein
MKCLECGVETAEATPACVVCGAPAPRQRGWRVKRNRSDALAGAGGSEDSTAGPVDSDVAGWAVPAVIPASVGQQPPESAQDSEVDGAIFAEWVGARKFSTTRLQPGYDMEEVDTFLDAIRDTFLGIREPSLTPNEIRDKQFSTTRLRPGYVVEEVDAFLDAAELRLAAQAGAGADAAWRRPWQ